MKFRYTVMLLGILLGLAAIGNGHAALAQTGNETANATANATFAFKNVALGINPEYDNLLGFRTRTLLVVMEGKLTGVQPPAQVSFLVPSSAGLNVAGSMGAQGAYSDGRPARKASAIEGWDEISYQLITDTFRVEYYDPHIISGFPGKTISYDFHTLIPISDLHVVVQQPRRSTNFSLTARGPEVQPLPTPTASRDSEGFNVYSYFLTDIRPEKPYHFDIAYTKADDDPSLSRGGAISTPVIIGIVLGLIAVGGLIIWLVKRSSYVPVRASRGERRRRGETGAGSRFCTQCGQRIGASDKFCPYCGAKMGD